MKKPRLSGELERWRLPSYEQAREARREARRDARREARREAPRAERRDATRKRMQKLRENRRQESQEGLRRQTPGLDLTQKIMGNMAAKRFVAWTSLTNAL
jgi:hypothetical protein